MKLAVTATGVLLSLACAGLAQAAPPTWLSVGQQDRHPTGTFTMPGANYGTIAVADKPDRATDGDFLQENIKDFDILTADEIQTGQWLSEDQLDPGTYYILLRASTDACPDDPNCTNGYSNVLSLTVPKPRERFSGRLKNYRYLSIVTLTLKVTPLGEHLPYRVCWRLTSKHRKCARGTVGGYSWNSSASDSLDVRTRGMAKRTTFTWYVQGHKVATRRGRIVTVR
jgi:hypothetical protein